MTKQFHIICMPSSMTLVEDYTILPILINPDSVQILAIKLQDCGIIDLIKIHSRNDNKIGPYNLVFQNQRLTLGIIRYFSQYQN